MSIGTICRPRVDIGGALLAFGTSGHLELSQAKASDVAVDVHPKPSIFRDRIERFSPILRLLNCFSRIGGGSVPHAFMCRSTIPHVSRIGRGNRRLLSPFEWRVAHQRADNDDQVYKNACCQWLPAVNFKNDQFLIFLQASRQQQFLR